MSNLLIETLRVITIYNEQLLNKVDGDQGAAVGLITFVDEEAGMSVWNPFYDTSLRFEVDPILTYTEQQLQSMVDQLSPKEVMYTGGNCTLDLYQVLIENEVRSIGVSEDCIVGFAEQDPFSVEFPTEIWLVSLPKEMNTHV